MWLGIYKRYYICTFVCSLVSSFFYVFISKYTQRKPQNTRVNSISSNKHSTALRIWTSGGEIRTDDSLIYHMATTGEDCAIKLMSTKLCSKWTKEIHVTYESTSIASRKQNCLTQRKSNNWNVWSVCISVGNNVVNDSWMVKNNVKRADGLKLLLASKKKHLTISETAAIQPHMD